MLELAVHNQGCLGPVFSFEDFAAPRLSDARPDVIRFIRRHEQVFTGNETEAEIAVLRSRHSGTLNWLQATEGRLLAQTSLLRAGLQWDNVIETGLDRLDRYRLLVLPETISVPTECLKPMAAFVRAGGRILAVGAALSRDEWGRLRSPARAAPLHGEDNAAFGRADETDAGTAVLRAWLGLPARHAGRLFAFPRLAHPNPLAWDPDSAKPPRLTETAHRTPLNHEAFVAAVYRALGRAPSLEAAEPAEWGDVVPTLLRARRSGALSLHLLRYAGVGEAAPFTVRIRLPGFTPDTAKTISPEQPRTRTLRVERERDAVVVRVPPFTRYAGILFPTPRGGHG